MASKWHLPPPGDMDKASGIYLQNMNMTEIAERLERNDVLIVPMGAEVHEQLLQHAIVLKEEREEVAEPRH